MSADIDGDGQHDLVALDIDSGDRWFDLAAGARPMGQRLERRERDANNYDDVTGDGIADLITLERVSCSDCTHPYLSLGIAEGDGTGRFGPAASQLLCELFGFGFARLRTADLDGDRDRELLLDVPCGLPQAELNIVDLPGAELRPLGRTMGALTTGDLDGDGHFDLVGIEPRPNEPARLVVLRGDGALGFGMQAIEVALPEGHATAVQLLDLDGDGGKDIAVLVAGASASLITFRWSAGRLEQDSTLVLPGPVAGLLITNLDADCGDELIAFSLTAENSHTHLQQVDPGAGSYADLKFPSAPAPDLIALLSVPTGADHEARIFGQTTKGELVEITPSSCGPPTQ